ncbi:hypothetical protein LJR153_007306 [Paenibacillus sp. LjRoot153]|uniref:hypothetical protein n=1 Tax=Paenibacillus sp. LjRoot153 TaxID=3342270 RepID=UPI003ED12401
MGRYWTKTTRNLVILFIGIAVTIASYLIAMKFITSHTTTKMVLVASEDLKPFSTIKEQVKLREIVTSEIPDDSLYNKTELEGDEWFVGEIGIQKDQPLRKSKITHSKGTPFGIGLGLPENKRLIGVKTDLSLSAGDNAKPGVMVDAFVYIKPTNTGAIDRETGQPPKGKVITPKDDARLKGLLVRDHLNSEGYTVNETAGKSVIPQTVVLEVNDDTFTALVQYQEEGKVYFGPINVNENYMKMYLNDVANSKETSTLVPDSVKQAVQDNNPAADPSKEDKK